RALQQHFLDLVVGETVAARAADVQRELVELTARDERGDRDGAPRSPVEPRSRPDLAPRVAGDQLLELFGQLRRLRRRGVDVVVAEHLAAHAHAVVVAHRKDLTLSLNSSGASTFARWAPRISATSNRAGGSRAAAGVIGSSRPY